VAWAGGLLGLAGYARCELARVVLARLVRIVEVARVALLLRQAGHDLEGTLARMLSGSAALSAGVSERALTRSLADELAVSRGELELVDLLLCGLPAGVGGLGQELVDGVVWH
jgi:hypothetical protein